MRPSVIIIRLWFDYDKDTGVITRKLKQRSNTPDTLNPKRERIDFFGTRYRVTHIIWVIVKGYWPEQEIDHIDFDRTNNKWLNLREATRPQNMAHRRWYNPNGKGVTFRKDKIAHPWQTQISVDGDKKHLGFFASREEAAEAYRHAALKYHGEFACLD